MAYLSKDLSVLAYANGFTLWYYYTPDTMQEVMGDNYFGPTGNMVRKGDMIIVVANDKDIEGGMLMVSSVLGHNCVIVTDMQHPQPSA